MTPSQGVFWLTAVHTVINVSWTSGSDIVPGSPDGFHLRDVIAAGQIDTRAIALGLIVNNALTHGDKLSVALAQTFAVSGGHLTLKSNTGISSASNGVRTKRVSLAESTVPLGAADRVPELHLGYLYSLNPGWHFCEAPSANPKKSLLRFRT